MINVDYTYYKDVYKGNNSEDDFERNYNIAFYQVDDYCFGRIERADEVSVGHYVSEKVKMCICAVIDAFITSRDANGIIQNIVKQSESVGPWSVSYATDSLPKTFLSSIYSIINLYLKGTGLMSAWC